MGKGFFALEGRQSPGCRFALPLLCLCFARRQGADGEAQKGIMSWLSSDYVTKG